jgi:hypothetical protein
MVALRGNVHGLAKAEFDQGRADSNRLMSGVSLAFKPSAAQQSALNNLLAQQQDTSSPNYHKWLTPAQFADRFGMSHNDINKVVSWLQSQGLTVTRTANSRNQVFFEGTVAQIEVVFHTEIHNYLVGGEMHYANATEPSVPAALSGIALAVQNLHNFQPKPRANLRRMSSDGADPYFTSHISGNHFLAPGDFATIYDVQALYAAGIDGAGQKIALTGQSSINLADVAHFRSAAGLPANVPTLLLEPGTGTSTRCSGDEGESDLDVEWSGAVAKNASVILVYAGLASGESCTNRSFGAFNALQYAIDQNLAPVISNSYGNCEANIGLAFAQTMQGWVQQANTQGQTVVSSSGDSGAADCDFHVPSATHGFAVDIPAAIPEVTGMGGTEFFGDGQAAVSGGNATSDPPFWSGTTGGNDAISSALIYIPEMGWNDSAEDIALNGFISASGGGASTLFTKPLWQTGTGVPADGKRDVPDLALNGSADHDGYLFCSEDDPSGTIVATCTNGFRDASTNLDVVGGTSAAAPAFAAIATLVDQYLVTNGFQSTAGLGNANHNLYSLAASNPTAFHDVTTGNNIVPCTSGTTDCPSGTVQFGFSAGAGYDQVTGLGSVDANALALAWAASTAPDFQLTASSLSPTPLPAGQSATATLTISPVTGSTGTVVNFAPSSCTGLPTGATCSFNPPSVTFNGVTAATTVLTISTLANMAPSGPQTITITPTNSANTSTSVSLTVSATTETFTLTTTATVFPVSAGGTVPVVITVNSTTGFTNNSTTALPLTYSCTGLPSESQCNFSPPSPTNVTPVTLNISTTAPITQLLRPSLGGGSRIFYALLLPGVFGIVFATGSRTRGLRLLSLIVVLGFSTLWMGACGGSSNSSQNNPGTPPGTYTVTISATTGGANPVTNSLTITLTVTAH